MKDVYPRPPFKLWLRTCLDSLLFYIICYATVESTLQIADATYEPFESICYFYTWSLLVYSHVPFIGVAIMLFMNYVTENGNLHENYIRCLRKMAGNYSVHGIVYNIILFYLTSIFLSNKDALRDILFETTLFYRMTYGFTSVFLFDMVGYPWHRLVHLQMLYGDKNNNHHVHHIDRKIGLNMVSGISASIKDLYPMYVLFFIFVMMNDITIFYLYSFLFFSLFGFEHCYQEKFPFISFHTAHHVYFNCNYADFFPFLDYIFGTLRLNV